MTRVMDKTAIRVSFLSLTLPDEALLKDKIAVASQSMQVALRFSRGLAADLLFLPVSSPFAHVLLQQPKDAHSPVLFFISEEQQGGFMGHPCINMDISADNMQQLLSSYLHLEPKPTSAPAKKAVTGELPFTNLTELAQLLLQPMMQDGLFALKSPQQNLILDFPSERFHVTLADDSDYDGSNKAILSLLDKLKLGGSMFAIKIDASKPLERSFRPHFLDRLLWLLGQHLRQHLLTPVADNSLFFITHYPDFGQLKTDHIYLRLCTLMAQQAISIQEMKKKFHLSHEQCMGFLNSCLLNNCLVYTGLDSDAQPQNTQIASTLSLSEIQGCRIDLGIK